MSLFEDFDKYNKKEWEDEWKNMPEFINEKLTPYQSIKVNFRNKKDREDFAKLLNQNLTKKTKSIWFPKNKIVKRDMVYINNE